MKPLVVIGDALLDVDIDGTAERLSPEAPVPVVDIAREWHRPGGAALAAMLAARSVDEVVLVSPLGADDAGDRVAELLENHVELAAQPLQGATPRKCRVRAGQQSLLRLDSGDGRPGDGELTVRAQDAVRSAGAVLVADYGRGFAANPWLRRLLSTLRVPVVWDPHPRGPNPIRGSLLVTPNVAEARAFAASATDGLYDIASGLRCGWQCDAVAVTTGSQGAVLSRNGLPATTLPISHTVFGGPSRPDTCGAGDRFASAAAAALLDGWDVLTAVQHGVDSASRFVAAGGAATLSVCDGQLPEIRTPQRPQDGLQIAERVRRAGGRVVATGGCFDLLHPGHIGLLRRARAMGDALVVCLNSDASVRGLKGPRRPIVPQVDRARMLAALESVDGVLIFDEPSPAAVLDRLRPDVWVKGGDYTETELPEAPVVRGYGGEVVLVPLLGDYSTTRIVATANGAA